MTHKQIIVIRKDLKMRRGKEIAQGCHASTAVILNLLKTNQGLDDPRAKPWVEGKFKKVCLVVNSEQELLEIVENAKKKGLLHALITDAGLTEFNGVPTKTCAAIGPDVESKVDEVTGELKLY
jgi:PTH2 family peptidyl-tRNA hydrolase